MGTTEFVVAGILPEIAGDLGTSIANVGLMITVFAIGMILGTPAMAILTLRVPRRVTLSSALIVFAIGHVIVALSSNFGLILGARFLTAVATGRLLGSRCSGRSKSGRPGVFLARARHRLGWRHARERHRCSARRSGRSDHRLARSFLGPRRPRTRCRGRRPPIGTRRHRIRCGAVLASGDREPTGRTHLARSARLRRRVRVVAGGVQLHLSAVDREHGTCCVGSAASACRLRTRRVRRLQSRRSTRCEASVRGLVRLGSDDVSRARGALPLLAQRDRDGVSRSHAGTYSACRPIPS